ncbi:uncharacterized protein K489DRAFT_321273, partial [Dissoconium aciculare CBS 342.82]|uniref:Uncharacterized protein n=1 Tax=Dissoconium aciculare CBS 342.82 TaxID=1314786 RepID=A0A6J3M2T1_9PEZI
MTSVELRRRITRKVKTWIYIARRRLKLGPPAAVLEAQPTSPPWPPQDILKHRVKYMSQIRARPPRVIKYTDSDTSLHCLYRIYEQLVLDHTIGYRNEIEYFWRRRDWPVADIPDPHDPDPTRYAFLAGIPHLLVHAFNSNIRIGLARYTAAIISPEEAENLQNTPELVKLYENVPEWTLRVKALRKAVTIPIVSGPDLVLTYPTTEPVT